MGKHKKSSYLSVVSSFRLAENACGLCLSLTWILSGLGHVTKY